MLIELFDTTLRDGTQSEGVNVSVHDKLAIAHKLDEFGIAIIEGGWPGSNPKDKEFFEQAKKLKLKNAQICAFGSTARSVKQVESDINLNALLECEAPVLTIFGKTWKLHSQFGLGIADDENEELIYKSVKFLKDAGRRVIFDAEHFFDGYKDAPEFSLKMLKAAVAGGASTITLCDTNGGSLPSEVSAIIHEIKNEISVPIGIHAHNDCELAVSNSIAAIQAGATHVQGTINGIGERCGNANLISIIPNVRLKLGHDFTTPVNLEALTSLSHFVSEIINLTPNNRAAFVGKSAFAHKGGIHVSAVLKESRMYEHIKPEIVGNKQRVLVSELSGQSNIRYKAKELRIEIDDQNINKILVEKIKDLEHAGFQYDGAEASFELLLRGELGEFKPFFNVPYYKLVLSENGDSEAEAVLKVEVNGVIEHTAANGVGPVNALDNGLRKALAIFYPEIANMKLVDYKVRVLDEKSATEARVRVMIESSDGENEWTTVGVSQNIIEASFQAMEDSLNFMLFKRNQQK